MNTSNISADQCSSSITSAISITSYAAFNIFAGLRFLIGGGSYIIVFLAFKKQTKNESGYAYQMFVTVAKLLEITHFMLHILLTYNFGGRSSASGNGSAWFMSSHVLMWHTAYVSPTLASALVTLTVLLSAAMAIDRAVALSKPFVYVNLPHKKCQKLAVCVCVFISILTSVNSPLQFRLLKIGGHYTIIDNSEYAASTLAAVFSQFRIVIRLASILGMGVSYAVVIYGYRKRLNKVEQMSSSRANAQKEIERRRHQKMLFLLVAFELPFILALHILSTANSLITLYRPQDLACAGALLGAIATLVLEITDMVEFNLLFAASSEFRKLVIQAVPCLKKYYVSSSQVVPISTNK